MTKPALTPLVPRLRPGNRYAEAPASEILGRVSQPMGGRAPGMHCEGERLSLGTRKKI